MLIYSVEKSMQHFQTTFRSCVCSEVEINTEVYSYVPKNCNLQMKLSDSAIVQYNKKAKTSQHNKILLDELRCKEKLTSLEQMLVDIIPLEPIQTTVLCDSSNTTHLLFRILIENKIIPTTNWNGPGLKSFYINKHAFRVISRDQFCNLDQDALSSIAGIEPVYRPTQLMLEANFKTETKVDLIHYEDISDCSDQYKKKVNYFNSCRSKFTTLHDETKCSLETDHKIFIVSYLSLLQNSIEFQLKVSKFLPPCIEIPKNRLPILTLYSKSASLNSYAFQSLRLYGFDFKKICRIECISRQIQGSLPELQWSLLHEKRHPNFIGNYSERRSILSTFNGGMRPDGVIEKPQKNGAAKYEAFAFNSCDLHGHRCELTKKRTTDPIYNRLLNDRYAEYERKIKKLYLDPRIEQIDDIHQNTTWLCEWQHIVNLAKEGCGDKFLQELLKTNAIRPPCGTLSPRDAYKGAFSELFRFFFTKKNENDILRYVDINSFYPTIARSVAFPVGNYKVLINKDLLGLTYDLNTFTIKIGTKKVTGAVMARIYPPEKKSIFPFLSCKINDRTYYTYCYKCAEKAYLKCDHSREERSWVGTYVTPDLEYGLRLGYSYDIYEIINFEKEENIFQKYFTVLLYFRLKHSGIPPEVSNVDDYLKILNDLDMFKSMNMVFDEIDDKPQLKEFFKIMSNSALGFMGMNVQNKQSTKIISSRKELLQCYETRRLADFETLGNNLCLVTIDPDEDIYKKKMPNTNVIIAAFLTSQARVAMHKDITLLESNECKVLLVSCDSLIYVQNGSYDPLESRKSSFIPGMYKDVLNGPIQQFAALSPTFYSISYGNGDALSREFRFAGCSLKSSRSIFKHSEFIKLLQDEIKSAKKYAKPNAQTFYTKPKNKKAMQTERVLKGLHIKNKYLSRVEKCRFRQGKKLCFFTRSIAYNKRVITDTRDYSTVPYGYF